MGKRLIDLILGGLLALVALPLIALVALAMMVSLRAWPFFVQYRVGRGGRLFPFVKIRTLPPHFPPYALKGSVGAAETPLRRFVRGRHLDELPQLLLVPLGLMSLVGPRPKMPDCFEPADPWYVKVRTTVPQGCTGLWQVGAHSGMLPGDRPEYDFFYLRQATLRLDMWILWRTVLKMAGIGRPVELGELPRWATGPLPNRSAAADPALGAIRQAG